MMQKGILEEVNSLNIAKFMIDDSERLSYSEFLDLASRMKWSMQTSGLVFSELKRDYVRISDDEYVINNCFNIEEEIIERIEQVISENMIYGFLSIPNFSHWSELPEIGYEWNCFLLHSVLEEFSKRFNIVETMNSDIRYERGVVVEKASGLDEYSAVVANFLKALNLDVISESKMLSLLTVNGLTYKLIPKELFDSKHIVYSNEKFCVRNLYDFK